MAEARGLENVGKEPKARQSMATITALRFEAADGADRAVEAIEQLQMQDLIQVYDAATITWPAGARRPRTQQLTGVAGSGALDGAFWGMLFGLIFFVPFFGMAVGTAVGPMAARFRDYGISDEFVKNVREKVKPGFSALFLLTSRGFLEKLADATESLPGFELITSNLSRDQELALRGAFGADAERITPGVAA